MWRTRYLTAAVILLSVCVCNPFACSAATPTDGRTKLTDQTKTRATKVKQQLADEVWQTMLDSAQETGVDPKKTETAAKPDDATNAMKKRLADEKTAAQVVTTEQDLQALDAYARGEYARAESLLRDALRAGPKRPFTLYLQGCVLFEIGKYQDAATSFDEAYALEPDSLNCVLLAEMSRQMAKSPKVDDSAVLCAYDVARKRCMERMSPDEDPIIFADILDNPNMFDPIRVRLSLASTRILSDRRIGIAADVSHETDIDRKITLAMMLEEKAVRPVILSLAEKNPEHKELQVFAFLLRYFGTPHDSRTQHGSTFAADLAAAQALEPDNGFLLLLGIDATDKEKPLNAAELALLKRAAQCKESRTYRAYQLEAIHKESLARSGAMFEDGLSMNSPPEAVPAVWYVVRRASKTVVRFFEDGKDNEACLLLSDIETLLSRIRADEDNTYLDSVADMFERTVAIDMRSYSERAHRADLLEESFSKREALARRDVVRWLAVTDISALPELPIRRLRETYNHLGSRSLSQERAARMLQLDADHLRDTAIKELEEAYDMEKYVPINDLYDKEIITLQLLKDPLALPMLEKVATSQNQWIHRLATKAIADIKANMK